MRLNLPTYDCVRFDLFSDFTVPLDRDDQIEALMDQTHTHDLTEGGPRIALFGSRSRTGGITHRVRGRLTKTARGTDLGIVLTVSSSMSSDNLRPPPKSYKPVSRLVEASSALFGPVSVSCHAVFEYDQRHGHKSKISLPIPLIVQEEASGVTHIESAQFSRRENEDVQYQIIVSDPQDSDFLIHSVSFDSTSELSLQSIRSLIHKARTISTQLLIPSGAV